MKKILLLLIFFCTLGMHAQCGMKTMSLQDRITASDLVIEGEVIQQESFEPDGGTMIFTRNTIKVSKLFKAPQNFTPITIDIITKGGVLGLRADKVTTALDLSINNKGIFTLKNYQNGTYQAIAGSQSFISYSQPDYKAYSMLKQWEDIENTLFNEITQITGTPYQRLRDINFNYTPSLLKIGTVTVSNISPINVNAGVGDVLTITGNGFGATQGSNLVVFSNADTGGSISLVPDNSQIEFWSDTEVRVQVPSGAGNGPVAIFIDNNNFDISSQNLAVGYNHVNFTFVLNDGTNDFNVVSEISLTGENGSGGYNFDYATTFAAESDASATLDDIYEKWRCTSGVNFIRGNDLTVSNPANTADPQTTNADNINVVKFDGSDLPGGSNILAFVLTRAAGCIVNGNELVAYVLEMDVVVNDAIPWHYRDGGTSSASLDSNEFDFESVMLHEIGHAQQLGHVIDPTKVMHFSIGNGSSLRNIDAADIDGALYINNKSTNIAPCGAPAMQLASCDFVYSNTEWSPFDPSGTFNINSTITIENGTTSINDVTGTKDITVDNGASLSTNNNEIIALYGNLVNNGAASINRIVTLGSDPQLFSGNMLTLQELDVASSGGLNLNSVTNITNRFNNDNSVVNTNGNLVLKSSASGTAHVDVFEGTINGNVTVERHYPSRRAFRFISPSVTTSSSIYENWQENGAFVAGLGTHITGSATGANGFDSTGSGNPSLFLYDNAGTSGWIAASSTNNSGDILTAGNAYRLFVRGDRDPSLLTTTNSNQTTLRMTGSLATGNVTETALNNIANGFSFAGNPYQAPVNMETVLTRPGSNLAPSYYVWDPNLNTRGAYVTVNTVTDATSNSGSPANKFAQPNQAFFIQTASNGPASLQFTEADKALSQGNLAINSIPASMRLSGILKDGVNQNVLDGFNILFDASYSNAIGVNDALKFSNLDESIAISQNGSNYSIAEREMPQNQESISLEHYNYRGTLYSYSIQLSNANLNTYLFDQYENMYHELVNNNINDIAFSVDHSIAASMAQDRFTIVFSNTTLSSFEEKNKFFSIYPNPSNGNFQLNLENDGKAQIEIFNMLGQLVHETTLTGNRLNNVNTSLSSGYYILTVNQNGNKATEKIIIQ